jgi:hypothetical protein
MRFVKFVLPAALMIAPAVFLITAPTPGFSTPQYAKDTKKACTFCHVKVAAPAAMHTDPNLTDAGKYYKDHNHSLDGYKPPAN